MAVTMAALDPPARGIVTPAAPPPARHPELPGESLELANSSATAVNLSVNLRDFVPEGVPEGRKASGSPSEFHLRE